MTREEKQKVIDAVERLNALKQFIGYDKDSETVQVTQKSLDMAIKALEQEPCREAYDYENEIADLQNRLDIAEYDKERLREEITVLEEKLKPLSAEPCEDCISRRAVLDMAEDMTDQFGNKHRVVTEGLISMLPPVTPKPKTDVLDKIRAEIKEVQTYKMFEGEDTVYVERKDVLAIINKYRTEKE